MKNSNSIVLLKP